MDTNQRILNKKIVLIKAKKIRQPLEQVFQQSHILAKQRRKQTCASISKLILKIAFWSLVYFGGSYLTISESINVYQQYKSNPTIYQITSKSNSTMKIPDYTLCFGMNATSLFRQITESKSPYSDTLTSFFSNNTKDGVFSVNR